MLDGSVSRRESTLVAYSFIVFRKRLKLGQHFLVEPRLIEFLLEQVSRTVRPAHDAIEQFTDRRQVAAFGQSNQSSHDSSQVLVGHSLQ